MLFVFGYGASLFIGVALGLLGGGGGILTVPVLHYLFQMDADLAIASSLFIVGITSAIATVGAAKRREVDFRTGVFFALPGFISVALSRRLIVPFIPESFRAFGLVFSRSSALMILFAVVMFASALAMLWRSYGTSGGASSPTRRRSQTLNIVLLGFFVGALTGLVGTGGGFLVVPALTILAGLPMKTAIGTSLLVIALNSTVGVVASLGSSIDFDWSTLLILTALSLAGMAFGQYLGRFISDKALKKNFAWFVFVMAIFISAKEFIWLFKQ
jgi:uncharacterized membrane protein YfcA